MTTIEWTEDTWNPIRARNLATGGVGHFCVHVSPGCKNCYAERLQPRYRNPIRFAAQDRAKVDVFLDVDVLHKPFRWKRARRIFPCSMTDLFGHFVPDEAIDKVVAVAALTERHTYQVLTKRADRMAAYWSSPHLAGRLYAPILALAATHSLDANPALNRLHGPLPNWWQGVSVEDQLRVDERIPLLLGTPAKVRWLSVEPLLEDVTFRIKQKNGSIDALLGMAYPDAPISHDPPYSLGARIDWIVVGGESGPNARRLHHQWVAHVVAEGKAAGVPVFVKQLGARQVGLVDFEGDALTLPMRPKHSKGGDPAEWPAALRVRQYPTKETV